MDSRRGSNACSQSSLSSSASSITAARDLWRLRQTMHCLEQCNFYHGNLNRNEARERMRRCRPGTIKILLVANTDFHLSLFPDMNIVYTTDNCSEISQGLSTDFYPEKAALSFEIQMILSIYSPFNKRFTSLVLVLLESLLSMAYFALIRYVTVKSYQNGWWVSVKIQKYLKLTFLENVKLHVQATS